MRRAAAGSSCGQKRKRGMTTVRFGFEKPEIDDWKVVCCVRSGVQAEYLLCPSTKFLPANFLVQRRDVSWQVAEKIVGHPWQAIGPFGKQHKGYMHQNRGATIERCGQ